MACISDSDVAQPGPLEWLKSLVRAYVKAVFRKSTEEEKRDIATW